MFDRIRVNHHSTRPPDRYQLGDVYLSSDGNSARVVITPDCDLVPRGGKPNALTVLTMAGTVRSFDKDATSADQFVFPSDRSEEHTSELQSLLRISYAVFCLQNKHHSFIIY